MIMKNDQNNIDANRIDFNNAPEEAYLYFPEGPNLFIEESERVIKRKIYEDSNTYLPFEIDMLKQLNSEIVLHNITIDKSITEGDNLRYLIANSFNINETIVSLKLLSQFKENNKNLFNCGLNDLSIEIQRALNYGAIYIHGRDSDFRPNIVINIDAYLKSKTEIKGETWVKSIIFLSSYIINNYMIPGQVETWNIIINLENTSLFSMPNDILQIIKTMKENFKGRVSSIFVFKLTFTLNLIKAFIFSLYPSAEKKVIVIDDSNYIEKLYTKINPQQLEKRFYGMRDNIQLNIDNNNTFQCFPLYKDITSDGLMLTEFKANNSNSEYILSYDDYAKRVKEGRVIQINKNILKKANVNIEEVMLSSTKNSKKRNVNYNLHIILDSLNDDNIKSIKNSLRSFSANQKSNRTLKELASQDYFRGKSKVYSTNNIFANIQNRKEEASIYELPHNNIETNGLLTNRSKTKNNNNSTQTQYYVADMSEMSANDIVNIQTPQKYNRDNNTQVKHANSDIVDIHNFYKKSLPLKKQTITSTKNDNPDSNVTIPSSKNDKISKKQKVAHTPKIIYNLKSHNISQISNSHNTSYIDKNNDEQFNASLVKSGKIQQNININISIGSLYHNNLESGRFIKAGTFDCINEISNQTGCATKTKEKITDYNTIGNDDENIRRSEFFSRDKEYRREDLENTDIYNINTKSQDLNTLFVTEANGPIMKSYCCGSYAKKDDKNDKKSSCFIF